MTSVRYAVVNGGRQQAYNTIEPPNNCRLVAVGYCQDRWPKLWVSSRNSCCRGQGNLNVAGMKSDVSGFPGHHQSDCTGFATSKLSSQLSYSLASYV